MRPLYFFALSLVLYELATYLSNDMIMPGMIQVINEFHAPQSYVALSLSAYIIGNCALLLVVGGFAERYGKRLAILLGNTLFLVFTILITFSQSINAFMLWRFLEGSGMAVIATGYALIHSNFNDKGAVKLIALMSNLTILAPLIGPVLGTLIVSHFSWRYVFYFTAILCMTSLAGLCRYTPHDKPQTQQVNIHSLIKQYWQVVKDKQFMLGTSCVTLITMPVLLWISQAPNLILVKLQQNYTHYGIYQLISISGMALSSALMQFLAGEFPIANLIKAGIVLVAAGLGVSVLGHANIYIFVSGQFIYTLGLGLANGCIFRLVMANKAFSTNLLSTMFGFIQTLAFAVGIFIANSICQYFNFSLLSFALTSFTFGFAALLTTLKYAAGYRQRAWE
ncbi:MAG: hypothetical protein K0S08_1024 [Gammaproteobacteria bacterium]|jgi:DHA1 family multidrug/chloramphenicol efflux transport protein-like MFS transporter|nr:hypothetical protein [Gammaproteobacteria bacterium]